jgi:Na+/H+ antiporter NhaD/arsenite permease-like protein
MKIGKTLKIVWIGAGILVLQGFLNMSLASELLHSSSGIQPGFLDGARLSPLWALPFLGIILSIAILPKVTPVFWGMHYGKIALCWSLIVLVGVGISQGFTVPIHSILSVTFDQFLPFIFLLLALFTITGGIKLHGEHDGTPQVNLIILIIGAILASWLGTTGAAVLLIRPLISANSWRQFRVHTVIFFIFIVGNISGSLTPIGNPPLLMGFISKVPFFWPLNKLLGPTLFTTGILLFIYFLMDLYFYRKEPNKPDIRGKSNLSIEGGWNFLLLLAVVPAVIVSGLDLGLSFDIYGVPLPMGELIEIVALLLIAFISMKITKVHTRRSNNFTWHPIIEVGKLFAGIFICMAPLIAMLCAGSDGPMKFIILSLSHADGSPINGMYYWLSGGLSAFLDSAPAYLIIFNTAAAPDAGAGVAPHLFMTQTMPLTLMAITAGASFMGAITYIGNAPNMMVKAIAEENGIKMPSFFSYMVWSVLILVPLFLLVQFLFIS